MLVTMLNAAHQAKMDATLGIEKHQQWKLSQKELDFINNTMHCIITSEMQKGDFATVYCGEMSDAPEVKVAVKLYHRPDSTNAERETAVLNKMTSDENNPRSFFILKLRESQHFIPSNMMFMDLYPVTLTEWSAIVAVPLDVIKLQLHMLVRAVDYCHKANIVHRDIKPDNVLIGSDLVPQLIDFGMVRLHTDPPIYEYGIGTAGFAAPEQELG